jgi:hypothetical protein
MTMDMTEPKVCKITMAGFVTELMAECTDISGTADTPSTATLFEIRPLRAAGREGKRFHSLVAKLLYLGKRSRPDILTTVAFLSTRVLKATEEDWKKLVKLVRYLRGTERLGIRLEANDPTVVMAYVDASFECTPTCARTAEWSSPQGAGLYTPPAPGSASTPSRARRLRKDRDPWPPRVSWDPNSDVHVPMVRKTHVRRVRCTRTSSRR